MKTKTFGRTGLEVTPIGFGGAEIGLLPIERERAKQVLNRILDLGINVIDTAAMYQSSEELIGDAIGARRDEYVLISKCGTSVDDIDAPEWSEPLITQTVDRALKRLRTDHLDVMLLHSCDLDTLREEEALGALVQAREAGKVRFVGYSGDNEAAAYAAALPDVAVIQTSINICDQVNVDLVARKANERNIGLMAKRPIANAAWKQLDDQPGMYQSYAATYTKRLAAMNIRPSEFGLQDDSSKSWVELALRFTLSQPGVHTAIVGTTNPDHVEGNVRAAEKGPLPDEALKRMRGAFQDAEAKSKEAWFGQT